MASATQISQLYVALFGRAADRGGMNYWLGQADGGQTLAQIASTMFATEPARTYYPAGLDNNGIIAQFYQNVLGRPGDAEGLAFWTAKLNAPGATVGSVISEMIDVVANYTGSDADGIKSAALFNNKVIVADWFTAEKGTVAGSNDILSGVTDNPASVEDAKSGSTTGPTDPGTGTEGQLIGLTDGRDTKTGTDGNDTFIALVGQNQDGSIANAFGTGDFLDGKGGWDKVVSSVQRDFNVDNGGATAVQPRTQNIEQVELEAIGNGKVTVDAGRMDSVKQFWTDNSSVDLHVTDVRLGSKLAITKDVTFGVRDVDYDHNFSASFESQSLKAAPDAASNSRVVIEIADLSTQTPATPLANVKLNLAFTINGQSVSITDVQSTDGSYAGLATAIKAALGSKGFGSLDVGLGNQYNTVTKAGNTVTLPGFTAQEILVTDPNGEAFQQVDFTYSALAPVPGGFLVAGDARASDPVVSSNLIETNIILDNAGRGSTAGEVTVGGMSNSNRAIDKANVTVDRGSKIAQLNSHTGNHETVAAGAHVAPVAHALTDVAFKEIAVTSGAAKGDLVINNILNTATFDSTAFQGANLAVTGNVAAAQEAFYTYKTSAANDTVTLNLNNDAIDKLATGVNINTGSGNDSVVLNNNGGILSFGTMAILNNVKIDTGAGEDKIVIQGNQRAVIETGSGSDFVYIDASVDGHNGAKGGWLIGQNTGAQTFVERVLYKAKLTVTFAGFESTVDIATDAAGNFKATQKTLNDAIKKAIADNPELKLLLTVTNSTNDQQIQIKSTVDGENDLAINVWQPELVAAAPTATQVAIPTGSELEALRQGLIDTNVGTTSDTFDTPANIQTQFNATLNLDGNLTATGANGVVLNGYFGFDAGGSLDATLGNNFSIVDLGTGANDLVVFHSNDTSANVLKLSSAWGKVSVVNFHDLSPNDVTTQAQVGNHAIDFNAFLGVKADPSSNISGNAQSAKTLATTLNIAPGHQVLAGSVAGTKDAVTNSVNMLRMDETVANSVKFSALTASDLVKVLNGDGGATVIGNITANTLDAANYVPGANGALVGKTLKYVVMVENMSNPGEYKVFQLTATVENDNVTVKDNKFDVTSATLLGTLDFGASINFNLVGSADWNASAATPGSLANLIQQAEAVKVVADGGLVNPLTVAEATYYKAAGVDYTTVQDTAANLAAASSALLGGKTVSASDAVTVAQAGTIKGLAGTGTFTYSLGIKDSATNAATDAATNGGFGTYVTGSVAVELTADTASAAQLKAIDAATTGLVNATAITGITSSSAADIGTVLNSAGVSRAANVALTLDDTTLTLAALKTLEAATTGLVNATSVTSTSGTVADALLMLVTNNGGAGDKISTNANVGVSLSDTTLNIKMLNDIDGVTGGTVTALNAATITDTTGVNVIDLTAAGITYHATNALTIVGGSEADTITLRADVNSLDTVVLNDIATADIIGGFGTDKDKIALSKAVMTELGAVGALDVAAFVSGAGAVATDAAHRIIFDTTNNKLYYDADGNGGDAAVHIATLTGATPVVADLVIIA